MFEELLRLLREFGASDELIADVEAVAASLADDYEGEPVADATLDSVLAGLTALADDDEASAALLGEAADMASAIRDEQGEREAAEAQAEADRADAARRLRGEADDSDAGDEGDEDGDDAGEGDDGDDPEASAGDGDDSDEGADEGADEREPVTASSNRATRRAAARRRPRRAAPAPGDTDLADIVFASNVPDTPNGGLTHDLRDVDRAMERLYGSFRRSSGRSDGGADYLRVATVRANFPEARRLVDESGESLAPSAITRRVQAVLDEAVAAAMTPEGSAVVAAGGLCAPPTPIYNVVTYGDARRPIRDQALVSFLASRGGVTDLTPPRLGDLSGAVSAWTVADDASATDGDPTKPCLRVTCGAPRTTQIEAIPLCLTVGNFLARTMNEIPVAWSSLGQVAHARFAESRLIAAMQTLSTRVTTTTSDWSATRDVLNELSQGAWGMRSRHRMAPNFPFRAVLPEVLQGIMQTDISRQMPGGSTFENLRLAAAELESWFRARNINVTWSPDMNIIGSQGAGTVLAHWPPTVNYLLYPEGTFIHLDGGELDLGVVRDSTLNRVNDFQVFTETFEGVHMVGVEAIDGAIDVCPTGAVSGSIDPAPFCASYSAA